MKTSVEINVGFIKLKRNVQAVFLRNERKTNRTSLIVYLVLKKKMLPTKYKQNTQKIVTLLI